MAIAVRRKNKAGPAADAMPGALHRRQDTEVRRLGPSHPARHMVPVTGLPTAAFLVADTASAAFAAATTTAAAATMPAAVSAAPFAWWAFRARTCFIHNQSPAVTFLAAQFADGVIGCFLCLHFHEGKTTRFARELVQDKIARRDRSSLLEMTAKVALGGLVGQIAYI